MPVASFLDSQDLSPGIVDRLKSLILPPSVPGEAPPVQTPEGGASVAGSPGPSLQAAATAASNAIAPPAPPGEKPVPEYTSPIAARNVDPNAPVDPPQAPEQNEQREPSPGTYVPQQWQGTERSLKQVSNGLTPEDMQPGQDYRNDAARMSADSAIHEAEANRAQILADQEAQKAQIAVNQQYITEAKQRESAQAQYIQTSMAKLEQLSQKAQAKVDPEAAKGSPGSQFMAAIAVGLGQFGAGLSGGQNAALQIVNANIDRNIKAQESNIANAKDTFGQAKSTFHEALAAFGDQRAAALATKAVMLDEAKAQAQYQFAQQAPELRNQANLERMLAGIGEMQAKAKDALAERLAVATTTEGHEKNIPGHVVGGSANTGEAGKEGLYVKDLGVYARAPEEATDLRKGAGKLQSVTLELQTVEDLLDQAAKMPPWDFKGLNQINRKIKAAAMRVAPVVNVVKGQGAMSEGDKAVTLAGQGLEQVDVIKGHLAGAVPFGMAGPTLEEQKELIRQARIANIRAYARMGSGQMLGHEEYHRDAKGNRVPYRVLAGASAAARSATDNLDDMVMTPEGLAKAPKK